MRESRKLFTTTYPLKLQNVEPKMHSCICQIAIDGL